MAGDVFRSPSHCLGRQNPLRPTGPEPLGSATVAWVRAGVKSACGRLKYLLRTALDQGLTGGESSALLQSALRVMEATSWVMP